MVYSSTLEVEHGVQQVEGEPAVREAGEVFFRLA